MSALATTALQQHFIDQIMPVVQRQASSVFRRFPISDREEATQGAVTLALAAFADLVRKGKTDQAFPSTLASFATKQVQAGRIVGGTMSSKDVLSRTARKKRGFIVARIADCPPDLREQLGQHDRSAVLDQVAFRMDYPSWLARLSSRKRRIAKALAAGERTKDVAKKIGVAASRIAQVRQELRTSWHEFHGEPIPA